MEPEGVTDGTSGREGRRMWTGGLGGLCQGRVNPPIIGRLYFNSLPPSLSPFFGNYFELNHNSSKTLRGSLGWKERTPAPWILGMVLRLPWLLWLRHHRDGHSDGRAQCCVALWQPWLTAPWVLQGSRVLGGLVLKPRMPAGLCVALLSS